MDPFRLLTIPRALQKIVHLVRHFDQSRCGLRAFSSKKSIAAVDALNDGTKKPRLKTVPVPKITLIMPDNSITMIILEQAERLAKRRNLVLTKVTDFDSKMQQAVYKLMSSSDYIENIEEAVEVTEVTEVDKSSGKARQKFKDTKLFYISAKITEYDLRTKIKNVLKVLNKGHKIKLIITLDNSPERKMKSIIEDMVKDSGNIQEMPSKKNMCFLVITPLSNNDTSADKKKGTDAKSKSET